MSLDVQIKFAFRKVVGTRIVLQWVENITLNNNST